VTLQQLSDAWNALRNAAQGRGVVAPAPAELAAEVAREHEAFRAWVLALGPFDTIKLELVNGAELEHWVKLYNALRARVAAVGIVVPAELSEPRSALGELGDTARTALWVAALGAGLAIVLRSRGGR
jgi:hypothetical protein